MSRVVLVHWKAGEAEEKAASLRAAGFRVELLAGTGLQALRDLRENPPQAFVIDLNRLPSHGRAVAIALRQQKATRRVPIVFLGGDPSKVEQTRGLLPDAVYSDWTKAADAVSLAMRKPPAQPVVPGTMQGYSGTPLPKKLGIAAGRVVTLLHAPEGFAGLLEPLPEGTRLQHKLRPPADVVLFFCLSQAQLRRELPAAVRAMTEGGRLWVVWPKKTSSLAGDLSEREVRAFGLSSGLVDYKTCAVDETWSGLCFARRQPGG